MQLLHFMIRPVILKVKQLLHLSVNNLLTSTVYSTLWQSPAVRCKYIYHVLQVIVIPKSLLKRVFVQIGMESIILMVLVAVLEVYGDGNMRKVLALRNW